MLRLGIIFIHCLAKVLNISKGIPEDKFFSDMLETANTVSATIPIGLKKAMIDNKINHGDKILLCGFGVGYSWGATIIEL